jgi:hypothetical protein
MIRMQTMSRQQTRRETLRLAVFALIALCLMAVSLAPAYAGPREQARRIHDRLAGVPPTDSTLDSMAADIAGGDPESAAFTAMENSGFYNITLKNWAAPWTNREQSVFVSLNDYTATVIGMVRDDVPFNTLLSADIVYVGDGSLGLPGYSISNNSHYEEMENRGIDLKNGLRRTEQSTVTNLPPNATAGIMTTRAAAEAFFIAGTNRAMSRFTMLNHLCRDMEEVHDTSRIPDRIRQDVARSPGGDSRVFLNNCIGCHSGMDPLTQAFAYYNFDPDSGSIEYTDGQVQPKYFNNADNFRPGYSTPDDRWDNYWRAGKNALLGWDPNLSGFGNGAKSLGEELGNSDAFAECQATKVFEAVCFRGPVDGNDRGQIEAMVASLRGNNYRLKQTFAEAAVYCMGD